MKAALFDLDGTLVNSERRSMAVWEMLLNSHGVSYNEVLLRGFMGRRGPDVISEVFPGADVEVIIAEIGSYYDHPDLPVIEPVPGAADLLRRIAQYGSPIALVTSARRWWAEERLDEVGVADLVRTIVSAEDVPVGKPHPAGFLKAAVRLDTHPSECVVFEDSLAGIAAAQAAGMTCVGVATTHHPDELSHADLVIADLLGIDWPLTQL